MVFFGAQLARMFDWIGGSHFIAAMYPSRLLAMVVLAVALPACVSAANLGWLHDLQQAKAKSAAERKPVLIEFTGSTWCPPCQSLTAQVLSTPEFAAFARDVVLVSLDYPAFNERTPEKVRANPNLTRLMTIKDEYQVSGFPTLIIFDANGTQRAKIEGYSGESAANFIAKLTGVTAQVRSEPGARPGSTARPELRGLLPSDQVTALEDKLKTNPKDSIARQQLLTHYTREQFRSPEARRARQRHVLWLIEYQPKVQLRGPEFSLNPALDGPAYDAGKQLWLNQVQAAPDDVELLERAANYLLLYDRAMAEEFLKKGEALDPTNWRQCSARNAFRPVTA
jgi:thiol-disulfide isomerase/thioredoxin